MNNTHQAVEAAVQRLMVIANQWADEQDPLQCGRSNSLRDALRAALTLPQDVAAEVGGRDVDDAYVTLSVVLHLDHSHENKVAAIRKTLEHFAASRSTAPAGVAGGVDASRVITEDRLGTAHRLAEIAVDAYVRENFGRMPRDDWAHKVLDLRDFLEAAVKDEKVVIVGDVVECWLCRNHPCGDQQTTWSETTARQWVDAGYEVIALGKINRASL